MNKRLTIEMEIVAKAKGSPRIFPIWMPFRRPYPRELSIFPSDGECAEPKVIRDAKETALSVQGMDFTSDEYTDLEKGIVREAARIQV